MRVAAVFSRLPVRVRVAAAFSLVMAALLAVAGIGLYVGLGATLRSGIDDALRTRAADVGALAGEAIDEPATGGPLAEHGETVAQILSPSGAVVSSSPNLHGVRLLTDDELARARREPVFVDRGPNDRVRSDEGLRLLARPVTADHRRYVVVVGSSLAPVEAAQHRLATLLLVGGPVLLLLASLAGYGAAAGALRPIDRMRREAASIESAHSGARLAVPEAEDELARLAATLNDMLERLAEASRRERAFVDDASHEMRTPLAIIKGELELALRDGATITDLRRAIVSAAEENDRLVRLTEDLLVLARADHGERPPVAPVPIGELVATLPAPPTVGVHIAPGSEDVVVVGSAPELGRALANLIRNAGDAGATRVEIEALERDDVVELHVRDDGTGFPDAFLPRAFERFARADAARGRGGTGLGLAIVRSVAASHGGTVHAANRAGGGADVWLTLPRRGPGVER